MGVSSRARRPSRRVLRRCSVKSTRGLIRPGLYLGGPSPLRILGDPTVDVSASQKRQHLSLLQGDATVNTKNMLGKAAFLLSLLALPLMAADPAPDSDWSQWKGPKRDGLSPDTGLLKSWPAGGPPLAWKATGLGGGFSSVSVHDGKIYTMGENGSAFNMLSLNVADGKILW